MDIQEEHVRILIVGDNWAKAIRNGGVSGNGTNGPFSKALKRYGFSTIETKGEETVWGGMRASDFSDEQNKYLIRSEIDIYINIDTIHLIIGGNDYLSNLVSAAFLLDQEINALALVERLKNQLELL